MKKDMDKILVTTPRLGSSLKNSEVKRHRGTNEKDYENLPSYSSMKPKGRRYEERKELNEYLNPLLRFLRKNCNRPWDKVYSEICENLDRRTAVQDHIFIHLFDYVQTKAIFLDGKPFYPHGWGWSGGFQRIYRDGRSFYVDPNGILKEPKVKRPSWKKEEVKGLLVKDEKIYLLREEDQVWFEFTIGEETYFPQALPQWIESLLPWSQKAKIRNRIVKLRTLSKAEKKALKLC